MLVAKYQNMEKPLKHQKARIRPSLVKVHLRKTNSVCVMRRQLLPTSYNYDHLARSEKLADTVSRELVIPRLLVLPRKLVHRPYLPILSATLQNQHCKMLRWLQI